MISYAKNQEICVNVWHSSVYTQIVMVFPSYFFLPYIKVGPGPLPPSTLCTQYDINHDSAYLLSARIWKPQPNTSMKYFTYFFNFWSIRFNVYVHHLQSDYRHPDLLPLMAYSYTKVYHSKKKQIYCGYLKYIDPKVSYSLTQPGKIRRYTKAIVK